MLDLRNVRVALVRGDQLGVAFGVDAFHRTQAVALLKTQLVPVESGCCLGDLPNEGVSVALSFSPVREVEDSEPLSSPPSPPPAGVRITRRRLVYEETRSQVEGLAGACESGSPCEEVSVSELDDVGSHMDEYEVLSCGEEVRPPQVSCAIVDSSFLDSSLFYIYRPLVLVPGLIVHEIQTPMQCVSLRVLPLTLFLLVRLVVVCWPMRSLKRLICSLSLVPHTIVLGEC